MAEPTTTTATAFIVTSAAAVPILTLFGMPLGLRADQMLAGFAGAIAAMVFLGTVPSSGDTFKELARTTFRRVSVAVASAVVAGYCTPLLALLLGLAPSVELGPAFILGVGAERFLRALIEHGTKKLEVK